MQINDLTVKNEPSQAANISGSDLPPFEVLQGRPAYKELSIKVDKLFTLSQVHYAGVLIDANSHLILCPLDPNVLPLATVETVA